MNLKRLTSLLLAIIITLFLITGCSGENGTTNTPQNNEESITSQEFDPNADFDKILEEAKGSTVNFYGWGYI